MILGNLLVRMALTSDTASSRAVLQSLLALSSLHRHDVHSQAVELKISAIKSLAAVTGSHIDTAEAMQHVAAGMLLCSFEVGYFLYSPSTRSPSLLVQLASVTSGAQSNSEVLGRFSCADASPV